MDNRIINKEIIDAEREILPEAILSEDKLLFCPLFKIDNGSDRDGIIEFKTTIEKDGKEIEISWEVYTNTHFGIPRAFDKKVFDAIQEIIEELPKPIQNPIQIGSLYNLCERMGIDKTDGRNYIMINNSLKRLVGIAINFKETFYNKGKKRPTGGLFTLFSRVLSVNKEIIDGVKIDDNYVYLSDSYLYILNKKPLGYNYYKLYKTLKSNISKRLYEILNISFHIMLQKNTECQPIRYQYDTLCGLIPLKKRRYLSLIRQQFKDAIKELGEVQFLEKVEIMEEGENFYLYFYPGPRARERFKGL